jgi:hypothetical protein
MAGQSVDIVLAGFKVMGLGMAGILATTVLFMLLTYVLRRVFPQPPKPGEPKDPLD